MVAQHAPSIVKQRVHELYFRRLSLNLWREIAAKETINLDLAPRVCPPSIESKGRLPILTRIFDVGHIVAFAHRESSRHSIERGI